MNPVNPNMSSMYNATCTTVPSHDPAQGHDAMKLESIYKFALHNDISHPLGTLLTMRCFAGLNLLCNVSLTSRR